MKKSLSKEEIAAFKRDGLLVLPDFINDTTCKTLKDRIKKIVDEHYLKEDRVTFSASEKEQDRNCNRYFLSSTENISFFDEKSGTEDHKPIEKLNKIAHALHECDDEFAKVSYHPRILNMVNQLMDYEEPAIVQSMYILKPPKIGGAVEPHQDASFLQMKDKKPCIGFWFALEDATKENACLWGWKGSHKKPLSKLWVRSKKDSKDIFDNEMKMINNDESKEDLWDKKHFDNYEPLEVKAGTLVLIHGNVLHRSNPNTSDHSRHAYTFHVADRSTWLPSNWIQRNDNFEGTLFKNKVM